MARGKKSATVFERGTEQAVIVGETTATVAPDATTARTGAPAQATPQDGSPTPDAPTVAPEAPADATPASAPRKRGRPPKASAAPAGDLTMAQLAERYIASLRDAGKGLGTQFSYSIDIAVAVKHFGAETAVATLTSRKVANYFDSDAVTKTRTGKAKAKPGIDKTRRVLRLALVWAAEQGLIAEAPIPESAMPRSKKDEAAA
jgi:hypothetical protein